MRVESAGVRYFREYAHRAMKDAVASLNTESAILSNNNHEASRE